MLNEHDCVFTLHIQIVFDMSHLVLSSHLQGCAVFIKHAEENSVTVKLINGLKFKNVLNICTSSTYLESDISGPVHCFSRLFT